MTRTTRVLYVEEISDEKDSKPTFTSPFKDGTIPTKGTPMPGPDASPDAGSKTSKTSESVAGTSKNTVSITHTESSVTVTDLDTTKQVQVMEDKKVIEKEKSEATETKMTKEMVEVEMTTAAKVSISMTTGNVPKMFGGEGGGGGPQTNSKFFGNEGGGPPARPVGNPKFFGGGAGGGGGGVSKLTKGSSRPQMGSKKHAFGIPEEMKTIEDTLLYRTLTPLFICMKISGIFLIRRPGGFEKGLKGLKQKCSLLGVYCVVIIFLLFINFLRSLLALDSLSDFDTKMFFKLLTIIFYYEAMSRAMLAFSGFWQKKKGYKDLFFILENLCYSDGIIPYEIALKKCMSIFIIISLITSLLNAACSAYGFFGPESIRELYDLNLIPVPVDLPGIDGFKGFLIFVAFINSIVAMFSLSFYTVICYAIYKEFEYLCRTFAMKISDEGHFKDDLERFRIMHQKRCRLVEDADQLFKYYIANTYLTNVPLLCLLLYNTVYSEGDFGFKIISVFRLVYVFSQMMVVSVAATLINGQAHAPLTSIYSIRVDSFTESRQLEVNMFLNKLTGTDIGLTAWDMFVINKPTVLTVIGMILTYFFLLMQFKVPVPPAQCDCLLTDENGVNCTMPVL